ncbi:MAG: YdjY domain-containing protein [Planctomycetia bacterium]|nr:YdjY domain-containing protein [Planctomycetia bacterium]
MKNSYSDANFVVHTLILFFSLFILGCESEKIVSKTADERKTPAVSSEAGNADEKSVGEEAKAIKDSLDNLSEKIQGYNDRLNAYGEDVLGNTLKKKEEGEDASVGLAEEESLAEEGTEEDVDDSDLDLTQPPAGVDEDWEEPEVQMEPIPLGDVLGEDVSKLHALDAKMPIWINAERDAVVLQGWVCQTSIPLEFFMCTGRGFIRTLPYEEEGLPSKITQFIGAKTHEAVLCVDVRPSHIHAGLLAIGAVPGKPVRFHPEFQPATGEEIQVLIRWKDAAGNIIEKIGQDLVKEAETDKKMEMPWVFAGSFFYVDEEDEQKTQYYAADSEGEIIGVSNFPSAVLDVPKASSSSNTERLFIANKDALPERGTPVTILLKIKKDKK